MHLSDLQGSWAGELPGVPFVSQNIDHFLLFSPLSWYFFLLPVPSSVQQPPATFPESSTCSFLLCHLCLASSRSYIVFFVLDFIVLISWVAFSLCYRSPYVRILFVCFDSFATLGDLAVTVSDSGICVSMMKNQDGLWGCC